MIHLMQKMRDALKTDHKLEEFNGKEAAGDHLKALMKVSVKGNRAERTCFEEK